jgi:Obg family GTPase CgtA-like protein
MVDQSNWEARMQFYRLLERMGAVRALEQAGVGEGDTVVIGRVEWEWV